MNIPNPIAKRGSRVLVRNYRKRPPVWEEGELIGLAYENQFGSFRWHYTVRLDRGVQLYMGVDGIRAIQ